MNKIKRVFGKRMVRFIKQRAIQHKCPCTKFFSVDNSSVTIACEDTGWYVSALACHLCRDFVNINRMWGCPCSILGYGRASVRARNAVKRWLEGRHKWQVKDKK